MFPRFVVYRQVSGILLIFVVVALLMEAVAVLKCLIALSTQF